jgi:uncharacterized membrane protein
LRPNYDPEVIGKVSERFARFLGTARFLVYMTVFVLSWVIWNVVAPRDLRFDDYPFIFLTLVLSFQTPLLIMLMSKIKIETRVCSLQKLDLN